MEAAQQESHQPKYRKRENKPGQKEKRTMKRTGGSPSPHRRQSRDSTDKSRPRSSSKSNAKNSNNNNNSNNSSSSSNGNIKTKSRKQNKTKKTKKSKLAFWFCVSANTDNIDAKTKAPVKKPKQKSKPKSEPKPESKPGKAASIEMLPDPATRVQDTIRETPTETLATKHSRRNVSKRYSAPPASDWTTVVTRAIVESPSQPPRSRTPTRGVRYRYDGTLERPYVYPGGLTFSGADKNKRFDDDNWVGGGADSSVCDTTLDNGSQLDPRDHFDEFDMRTKFYLRYDFDPHTDRRYSVPADFVAGNRPDDNHGQHFGQPELDLNTPMPRADSRDAEGDTNVIYDIPYESENDSDKNEVQEDAGEKRNSYYSKPLQNSRCIYMWHSCEDLQHCEERYHSKEGINRICDLKCHDRGSSNCRKDNHKCNVQDEDVLSASSVPVGSITAERTFNEQPRKMSLPVELSCDQLSLKPFGAVSNADTSTTLGNDRMNINDNPIDQKSSNDFSESGHGKIQKQTSLPVESTVHFENPFKRNLGRSSCMPGNKRFFLPPPPCYTPPKEAMEAALPLMSQASRHCGSQTDLTEDVENDLPDMEDRDFSLKREQNQSQYATILQGSELRLNIEMPSRVKRDEPEKEKAPPSYPDQANGCVEPRHSLRNGHHTTDEKKNQSQTVLTSTPRPVRKMDTPGEMPATHTFPKPVPRKRIRNKDSQSSSFSTSEPDPTSPVKKDAVYQLAKSASDVVAKESPSKVPPVPKKRRSQMIELELTYTAADIEKGLASCDDDDDASPSRSVHNARIIKTTTSTIFTTTTTTITNNINKNNETLVSQNQTHPQRDNNAHGNKLNHKTTQMSSTKSVFLGKSPPMVDHRQINFSPSLRQRLNSSLSSSVEGGASSPSRDAGPYSPSVDKVVEGFRRMPYDSDNDDNCNADDEMSIHNEDLSMAKSASVQSLLRSRSIFDRSLAVTRKRRQRMRDRKCQSQLLSSAEFDQYDAIHIVPGNHLWKNLRGGGVVNAHAHPGLTWASTPTKHGRPDSLPAWRETSLWKHSYTDSGHDSDMMSPVDSRHNRSREILGEFGFGLKCGRNRKGTVEKKSWELRLREKHELRKARSIEHLCLTQEPEVVKKPSIETCV